MICIVLWTMASLFLGAQNRGGNHTNTSAYACTHARTHKVSHAKSSFCHKTDGFQWVRIASEAVPKSIDSILAETLMYVMHAFHAHYCRASRLQMEMEIYLWYSSENVACFGIRFRFGFAFLAHFSIASTDQVNCHYTYTIESDHRMRVWYVRTIVIHAGTHGSIWKSRKMRGVA